MPEWQTTRVQMDMCPLAGTEFSLVANVVFIFDGDRKHHWRAFVNGLRGLRGARIVPNPQRVAGQTRWQNPTRSGLAKVLRVGTTRASPAQGKPPLKSFQAVKIALSDSTGVLDFQP